MIQAFNDGVDIHTTTASQVFGVPVTEVDSTMRRQAKAVNFGVVYGISDFGLSADLGISVGDAKRYIGAYFEKYSGVKQYLDNCVRNATINGYIKSILGRIRYIPELKQSNKNIIQHGQRIAMNMPMQGSATDIIKLAMIQVDKQLKGQDAYLIHQIHDELIIECNDNIIDQVQTMLVNSMSNAYTLKVPLLVDVEISKEWN
jgi:DNA polymerase-1